MVLTLRPKEFAELAANPAPLESACPAAVAALTVEPAAAEVEAAEVDVGVPNDVIAGMPIT